MRQRAHPAHEDLVACIGVDVADEGCADLDVIEAEIVHVGEAREVAARVLEADLAAKRVQGDAEHAELDRVAQRGALLHVDP